MPENPVLLPEESSPLSGVTINQFIQLVNQNNTFPDASTLDSYKEEDKEWIKKRTEIEQQFRHPLMSKLVDNEHHHAMAVSGLRNKASLHGQTWGGIVILATTAGAVALLWHGLLYEGLGLLAIVMVPPVASALANKIVKKFSSSSEDRD